MDRIVSLPQPHTSEMDPQTQGFLYKNLGVGGGSCPGSTPHSEGVGAARREGGEHFLVASFSLLRSPSDRQPTPYPTSHSHDTAVIPAALQVELMHLNHTKPMTR